MVTGAGRGIGRATAVALAQSGFDVGLVGRTRAGLAETESELAQSGGKTHIALADVNHPEAVRAAVADVEAHLGGVDVLVNNAGTLHAIGPLWEVDSGDWWTDVRTSLGGVFTCCREVVPGMIERGRGRIVNLTSYVAARPSPYQTGYAAGKAGVATLTEALALSLEPHGVYAFSVAPGFTDTEMTRVARQSDAAVRWLPDWGGGRVVDADRSAWLIAWLASGSGDALSGRFLHALDDPTKLIAEIDKVRGLDLYAPRIRRLD
jgi:3-oxoacyl-[acyl-carrier protein] reductase